MMMEVIEHEYPLKLIDLQVHDEDVDESDEEDEEEDMVIQVEFSCTCKRCREDINEYHRYYYKCIDDLCDFSLHKFCAEVPTTLKHTSHEHTLTLFKSYYDWRCEYCKRQHEKGEVRYVGSWYFSIDVNCAVEGDKRKIYHPGHPHPLVSLLSKSILCECKACGKEHKGIFFLCTTCSDYAIHRDCAFLPKRLLIQQTTDAIFSHIHPLTLSYSFPEEEKIAKYYPTCRICGEDFIYWKNFWIYKCEKCIYYVHLNCATSRGEPFMSILSTGGRKDVKNFKDIDYHNLLHLPFLDETYNVQKHLFFNKAGPTTYGNGKVSLQHINHQHELILVDTESIGSTSSKINELIMCHNPMKKIQLLCNGCVRPITEMPFYKCKANEDESCNFALHEWCTRLPTQVDNHPGHPQHTLVLMSNAPCEFFNTFYCGVCRLPCNGYAYGCLDCGFYVDVTCGLMPEKITHESHPNHLLSLAKVERYSNPCLICRITLLNITQLIFTCSSCNVYIHSWCALLLPKTIRHPYDKHSMRLSYLPIENHKSKYFCEICEEDLNPNTSFYHCDMCSQSIHSDCAPLILQCETETHSFMPYCSSVYNFLNVKFGSTHKIDGHPHPLLFAQGIENDGGCSVCDEILQYKIILRCLECRFAVHDSCSNRLNKIILTF